MNVRNPFLPSARDNVAGRMVPNGYPQGQGCPPWQAIGGPAECGNLVGFLDALVELGTQTVITVTPQGSGCVKRLIATDTAEDVFQLDDFTVARLSLFPAVPLSFASLKSDSTEGCMRTAANFTFGTNLVLSATNFTAGGARLSANAYYQPA